jgi:integrase
VFVDARGVPLRYIAVKETFDRLVGRTGIVLATKRRPRLHDLRHTFAVRALQGSPADRSRSGAHMAALATYMGHVNIYATYWIGPVSRPVRAPIFEQSWKIVCELQHTPAVPSLERCLARPYQARRRA